MFKWIALALLPFNLLAQNTSSSTLMKGREDNSYGFLKGLWYQPYFNQVWVYSAPNFSSKPYTKLTQYTDSVRVVEVIANSKPIIHKGMIDNWLKVDFPFKGGYYVGYIPAHVLARTSLTYNGITFLYHTKEIRNDSVFGAIKLLNGNQFLQEYMLQPTHIIIFNEGKSSQGSYTEADYYLNLYEGSGLDGVDQILEIVFSVSPCATSNEHYLLTLNKNRITGKLMVYYSYEDEGIFERRNFYPAASLKKKNTFVLTRNEIVHETDTTYFEHYDSLIYTFENGRVSLKDSFYLNLPAKATEY